jgi:uncharacterized cupin superfamily protein
MPKKIDVAALEVLRGTFYPPPYHQPCLGRERRKLGDAAGLTQFGVNLLTLPPGGWSSQRHWHRQEDEFTYVVAGEVVLVTDDGEETLRAGDCAGFKAGEENGHHFQNRSDKDALLLDIGSRTQGETVIYSGIDLVFHGAGAPAIYTHANGTPYEDIRRRSVDDEK